LEVFEGDRRLALGGAKHRALLAILLLNPNRVVSTDRLIELLWGDEPPETVNNTLQVGVSQLRKVLEPGHIRGMPYQVLVSQEPGYLLRVAPEQLDLCRFERLREEARRAAAVGLPADAAAALRQALALWRGPPLADLAAEPYAIAEANRLHETRIRALEDRIEADLALARHGDLVGELEALVGEYPLRERLRAHLMLALYRSGRQGEASEVFHKTRAVLVEELAMEPGPELQKLLKAILNQDSSLDLVARSEAASPRKTDNLPLSLTSFVGRIPEVAEVKRLCFRSRLVTLTGAGGIGKTRLAIKVATELVSSFRDGACLVELAPLSDPARVPQTVATALGVREQPGVPITDSLVVYLERRQVLLLLDNCEHLVDGSAQLADGLLRKCPDLRVLATSREPLGIGGESTWRVPSLPVPDLEGPTPAERSIEYGAIALFADRAATALGSFDLTENNGPLVLQVCRRLDGIPLAIELAVGKLKALSLEQIAGRLDDRFHLLTGGSRTALPRQQTLEATIDWSYDLLPAAQQAVLRKLSVFAGGFNLEAAEAVCSEAPDHNFEVLTALTGLIDKSLLLTSSKNGEIRYQLLETIGHYASRKLDAAGELVETRRRHRDWFLSLAERAQPELRGSNQVKWFERLETEHDNLRAGFEWSLRQDQTESALRLASAMGFFWMFQGHIAEGREWLERAIGAAPAALSSLTATATAWAAQLAGDQYDYQKAVSWAAQSLEVFRGLEDHWGIGFCSLILGNQSLNQDELEAASRLFEESHAHFRLSGSRPDLAKSLDRLGCVKWMKGDYDEAARLLSESRDLSSSIGNHWYAATAMVNLSRVALSQGSLSLASKLLGESLPMLNELNDVYHACMALHMQAIVARREKDYPRALLLLEQSAAPLRELGDPVFLNYCLGERGVVRWLQGSLDEALMLLRESATVSLQLRDKSGCAMWVEALGGVCLEMGEPMWAAKLFGAAEAMREQIGTPLAPHEQADHNSRVARLPSRRGRADVQNAWNFGRAEPLERLLSSLSEWIDGRDALRDGRSQGSKRPVGAGASRADQRDKVSK
jgi:predicted ATPase/DNA-binding SARP family transcriptional activator